MTQSRIIIDDHLKLITSGRRRKWQSRLGMRPSDVAVVEEEEASGGSSRSSCGVETSQHRPVQAAFW